METLAFGTWPSPLSADLIAAGAVAVGGPAVRGDAEHVEVWWSELRPADGGRTVLVRNGLDRTGPEFNVRTRVHEYGGGAWWLGNPAAGSGGGAVYFANWGDQRLYRFTTGPTGDPDPRPLTPEPPVHHGWRYADGRETVDGRWVVCVREDHTGEGEAVNALVAIPTDGSAAERPDAIQVLTHGADFVASPRISPDGEWICWVEWDHPNMPWDSTRLLAAPLFADARLGNPQTVADGPAVVGPGWRRSGDLVFSSDESGWWNLRRWSPGDRTSAPLTSVEGAEIGGAMWVFGMSWWTELDDGNDTIAVVVTERGRDRIAVVEAAGTLRAIGPDEIAAVSGLVGNGDAVVAVAAFERELTGVVEIDAGDGAVRIHRAPTDLGIEPAWLSVAEAIEFDSGAGRANAFFYPPTAAGIEAPPHEKPPLVVMGHGGPTSHAGPQLSLKVQYWTTRGFAVADVNYRGSTGFGTEYRRLLDGNWGVVDVEDVIAVAEFLAQRGSVDPDRIAIRGGSAGGFTVLAALEQSDVFGAGTNLFGVADLEALATDTHKFESRYLDSMIGPWPEARDLYEQRSPINHTDGLSSPLLVMQGSEDEVVPPSQSEAIVAAVAEKDLPHAYVVFEGEQHGFRRSENIVRSYEAELWFYGEIFGFDPADDIEPLDLRGSVT